MRKWNQMNSIEYILKWFEIELDETRRVVYTHSRWHHLSYRLSHLHIPRYQSAASQFRWGTPHDHFQPNQWSPASAQPKRDATIIHHKKNRTKWRHDICNDRCCSPRFKISIPSLLLLDQESSPMLDMLRWDRSLSGSAQSKSQISPVSGTSVGRTTRLTWPSIKHPSLLSWHVSWTMHDSCIVCILNYLSISAPYLTHIFRL